MNIILLLLFLIIPQTQQNISMGVKMTPLIEVEKNITINTETEIKLISGLQPHMLTWHHKDVVLETPKNLIIKFPFYGDYVPYIGNYPQHKYTITIE